MSARNSLTWNDFIETVNEYLEANGVDGDIEIHHISFDTIAYSRFPNLEIDDGKLEIGWQRDYD